VIESPNNVYSSSIANQQEAELKEEIHNNAEAIES